MPSCILYVGAYTAGAGAPGLHLLRADLGTGRLHALGAVAGVESPSFLCRSRGFLYAACELPATGRMAALRLGTGLPQLVNTVDFAGGATCHLAVWPGEGYITAANYATGSFTTVRRRGDGSLGAVADDWQSSGSGPNSARQEGPHAHGFFTLPGGLFAGCDLGADRILLWRGGEDGRLVPAAGCSRVDTPPGSGPRHMAVHPNGRWVYLVCELSNQVLVYDYHAATGIVRQKQSLPTLAGAGKNKAAEVAVSEDGRFVYASNRGDDTIAVYAVEEQTGSLRPAGWWPAGGSGPRHFTLLPGGAFAAVANEDSGDIALLGRDIESGGFTRLCDVAKIDKAVCVLAGEMENG